MLRQLLLACVLAALARGVPARAADDATAREALNRTERHLGAAAVVDEGHAVPGHESEKQPDILEPQPSLAIWTVVVFLGLLFVLGKFAWKPLLLALHQREEHLEHCLLDTEKARNESEQLLAEHRRRLTQAEDEVRALIEQARRDATAAADEIIKRAQAEAEASQERARREIGTARDQALHDIWSKTADLAVAVAGKVLEKNLDENDQRRLVAQALEQMPTVGANGHGHGGARA